jgi:hypothetical protein
MPWATVEELKGSELWKRMKTLHAMGSERLRRFLATFTEVYERAKRNGASEDEAEARAIPIALTAAVGHFPPPAGRKAEAAIHLVPLMTKHMASVVLDDPAEAASVNLVFPDAEDVSAAAAGNVFFGRTHLTLEPHIAEPQGIIRRVVARSALAEPQRNSIDQDFPLVAEVSFFEDVPQDERIESFSPDWMEFKTAQGTLAVPFSFATVDEPANPPSLGFRIIRATGSNYPEKGNEPNKRSAHRRNMADGDSPDANQEVVALHRQAAALQKELDSYKQKAAAAEAAAAEATQRAAAAEKAEKQRAAKHFADETFAKKEVPAVFEVGGESIDAKVHMAAMFLKDSEMAAGWAAMMPDRGGLRPGHGKAATGFQPQDSGKVDEAVQRIASNANKSLGSGRVL